jgi:hypothetical protein
VIKIVNNIFEYFENGKIYDSWIEYGNKGRLNNNEPLERY